MRLSHDFKADVEGEEIVLLDASLGDDSSGQMTIEFHAADIGIEEFNKLVEKFDLTVVDAAGGISLHIDQLGSKVISVVDCSERAKNGLNLIQLLHVTRNVH